MEGKITHTSQCAESRSLVKSLKSIFDINSFEQKCVIIKELLKSKQQQKS